MKLGILTFAPVYERLDLVAEPVRRMLTQIALPDIYVAEIDADLADTAAFCDHYQIDQAISANCVVVEAKRADKVWYAACMILATDRIDVNGAVRKQLDARKVSFAPMGTAVSLSSMEYGGITPIGLPADWPILIDSAVAATPRIIIGSGIRGSKLLVSSASLARLPHALILAIAKT